MALTATSSRLDRPVDSHYDHILGPESADITLVEYGSYACPYCRAANERIAIVRDRFGERIRYVFRHRPVTGSEIAVRAAELVERTEDPQRFWDAHLKLMTRSDTLTEEDLVAVAKESGLTGTSDEAASRARQRVEADIHSARASGVAFTPTFFINGRRYEGAWDESSLSDAMLGSLGHRVRSAALDFASWAPSSGVLLLVASIVAVALMNSMFTDAFLAFWSQPFALTLGVSRFELDIRDWVNDGLLTIFFLVVGLEIKREFTVGTLATRRAAALPIAAAIGGMVAPAIIYTLIIPDGPWAHGWGVPMATDTAFAVALIVMLGARVPVALRVFLTAAAIVDDIGAIVVVAIFYSGEIHWPFLAGAAAVVVALALLNRSRVYRATPYLLLGVLLWICVHASGLHATLAGVLLSLFIPTRPPANLNALMTQANAIVTSEARHGEEVLRHGPSLPALRALDARFELCSPATLRARKRGCRDRPERDERS
jgi:Na+:H+ antiporter, NhaA family